MPNKAIKLKTTDGYRIAGVHTITKAPKHVVLWLHGITVNKDEYLNMFKDGAAYLEESGIDSLRIDFRGHGASSGSPGDFTLTGQLNDVDSALRYLQSYYKTKITLHIVGCSFGAPPSIISALSYPAVIKSIILIAPVLSYKDTFIKPSTQWAKDLFNTRTIEKLYKTNKLYFDRKFFITTVLYKEMMIAHPEIDIKNVVQRILIIHGSSDTMVPYNVSQEISLTNKNVYLKSMTGMDHGFNDENDEEGTGSKSLANKQAIYLIIKDSIVNGL